MSRSEFKDSVRREWKLHRRKMVIFFVLRIFVVGTLIAQIFNRDWNNVFLCVLTLILFMMPSFLEHALKIDLPNTLEIIIVLFIFSAEILGEINEYYILYDSWDTMLHTLNGFLCAAIGLSLIDILNRSDKVHMQLSSNFVVLYAFCFSMTIGVIWEFFEYFMDQVFGMDMQKDVYIDHVTSALLNPTGNIEACTVDIESVVINGEEWTGYIDIGLHDTMSDMFVNFIGALVFSVFGKLYLEGRREGSFIRRFIPVLRSNEIEEVTEELKAEVEEEVREVADHIEEVKIISFEIERKDELDRELDEHIDRMLEEREEKNREIGGD